MRQPTDQTTGDGFDEDGFDQPGAGTISGPAGFDPPGDHPTNDYTHYRRRLARRGDIRADELDGSWGPDDGGEEEAEDDWSDGWCDRQTDPDVVEPLSRRRLADLAAEQVHLLAIGWDDRELDPVLAAEMKVARRAIIQAVKRVRENGPEAGR